MNTRDGHAPAVVALVLNWKRADATLTCLADLRACSHPSLRVLAMDNGSGDGSAERIRAEAPEAELLAFPENLGYCAAMNRGIARARQEGARYVLFLNNDTRVPPGFLTPLVEALEADPTAAGAGPRMLLPDGRIWCAGGVVRFGPNLSLLRGHLQRDQGQFPYPVPVSYMPGACVLYRLEDLVAVGGLDESYFMYHEDVDLGLRLQQRNRRVLYIPWSVITHDASLSTGGGVSPRRKLMSAVNSVRFLRRHGTPGRWAAFVLCDVLALPLVLLATLLRGRSLRPVLAKARGVWLGLRGHQLSAKDVEAQS
jgi:GT2 family glycosyltransferase